MAIKMKAVDLPDTKAGINAKYIADLIGADTVDTSEIRARWAEMDAQFAGTRAAGQSARVRTGLKLLEDLGAIKTDKEGKVTLKARVVGPSIRAICEAIAA